MKLSKCIGLFLNFKSRELSKRTIKEYGMDLNLFMRVAGDRDVESIKVSDVMMFRSSMNCSASLINRRLSSLNTFFNYLIDMEMLKTSPVKRSIRIKRVKQRVPKALTYDEIDAVMSAASKRSFRDYVMIKVMLYCGLRVSEMLGLRKESIQTAKGKKVLRVVGKGNKERFIPIPKQLSSDLEKLMEMTDGDRLFPISYQGVRYIFDRIKRETGIKIHPHKLRHTFATILVDKGIDIRVIQEFLGHASPNTTARYAKVRQNVMFDAVEKVFG